MRPWFFFASVVVVLLMFLVPFTLLRGVEGPHTALFWVLLSGGYLILVWQALRRE